jgi:DNA-binding transcriptional LysR family regulator
MRERDVVSGMAVFVAVVESGSLTAAARRLGLSTSAVSKLVSRLEHGFGTTLLRRTTRSMTVTEAGQTYFDRARSVLEELRAVEQEMASKDSEPRGLVRVSASQLLGQTRVMPILLALLKKTPTVSLDLELTDRVVDMVGERIDVAVRITSEPPPSFVARRVGTIRRVLCASPSYLRTHRAPRTPRDLDEHACLLLSGPAAADTWQFVPTVAGGPPESVRVTPRLRVSTTLSLYEAAKAGLGIADLPRYLVEEDLRARRLVAVLEPFETLKRGVFVVYAAGPLLPARVRLITGHLVQELEKALDPS